MQSLWRSRIYTAVAIGIIAVGLLPGCGSNAQIPQSRFDAVRAFAVLKAQCDFGPRPVGTAAHESLRDYLAAEFRLYTKLVECQSFVKESAGKTLRMTNIIARFGDSSQPGVLLCAHWDTRPISDQEDDPAGRKQPILGANDGASGVAVLMELARIFHERQPSVPVTIVLFDGEDYGPSGDDMFFGSRYYASKLDSKTRFRYGVLIDMIGDKDLQIYREVNSEIAAGPVNTKVWATAARLGYGSSIIDRKRFSISDDHIPLIRAGVKCIDMIDFDYPYWHTTGDTVDKCSPESLKVVGDTLAELVYSEQP